MWEEKCLIKVSKCSKISLYWIFYTKNRIFLHGKTLVFRLFYLLTYKKDKYIIIKKMFYISNKTFFAKKKICFAIFVIQMKKRERNKETKKQRNKRGVLPFGGVQPKKRKSKCNTPDCRVQYEEGILCSLKEASLQF